MSTKESSNSSSNREVEPKADGDENPEESEE